MNRFHGSSEPAASRTESGTNEMENCEINVSQTNIFAVSPRKCFHFFSAPARKSCEKIFSSSYRLSAYAKSQLKNAKFAVATTSERKKQRFRSPLSDVVELFRLTLDTEEKKILLGQKRGIFYSTFLLITALCEIMKNAPIFYESLWLPMMLLAFARTGGCFHSNLSYSSTVFASPQ